MDQPRILVVEDHEAILVVTQDILEGEGYSVLTAHNGAEALPLMEETRPDLIVADIMMPKMDGYALYAAVRACREWVPIPFIFLTAKTEKQDVLKGKALGAEDYVTKPFSAEDLLMAVRARLGRAQAIRGATEAEFDRLKQQVVIMLGHELRTPLTNVVGYTELALNDVSSLSPAEFHEYLMGIRRGADRLARLVQDLLLLVQLDTGRVADEFRQLALVRRDLNAVVARTVKSFEAQAANRGVTLEARLAPDLPPVQLCESFFVNALGRLVDNGIKFSLNGKKRVTVSARPAEGGVEVAVTDEGVGISPDDTPHLFERFRQINRQKIEQQGIGLGLAIARDLIRLHGGDIAVESTPDTGSTFTIRLPVAKEDSPKLGIQPIEPNGGRATVSLSIEGKYDGRIVIGGAAS
jgi:two-component system, sensor histidine kinase and response regulator